MSTPLQHQGEHCKTKTQALVHLELLKDVISSNALSRQNQCSKGFPVNATKLTSPRLGTYIQEEA